MRSRPPPCGQDHLRVSAHVPSETEKTDCGVVDLSRQFHHRMLTSDILDTLRTLVKTEMRERSTNSQDRPLALRGVWRRCVPGRPSCHQPVNSCSSAAGCEPPHGRSAAWLGFSVGDRERESVPEPAIRVARRRRDRRPGPLLSLTGSLSPHRQRGPWCSTPTVGLRGDGVG